MLRHCKKILLLLAVCGFTPLAADSLAQQDDKPAPSKNSGEEATAKTPREEYDALVKQYQAQAGEYRKAAIAAKTPEE